MKTMIARVFGLSLFVALLGISFVFEQVKDSSGWITVGLLFIALVGIPFIIIMAMNKIFK